VVGHRFAVEVNYPQSRNSAFGANHASASSPFLESVRLTLAAGHSQTPNHVLSALVLPYGRRCADDSEIYFTGIGDTLWLDHPPDGYAKEGGVTGRGRAERGDSNCLRNSRSTCYSRAEHFYQSPASKPRSRKQVYASIVCHLPEREWSTAVRGRILPGVTRIASPGCQ